MHELRTLAIVSKKGEKKNRNIDWEKVEKAYRRSKLNNTALAKKFNCAESSIRNHAKKGGWIKDHERLAGMVKDSTKRMLATSTKHIPAVKPAPDDVMTDEEFVNQEAQQNANLINSHRNDIHKTRAVLDMMIRELAVCSTDPARLEEALETFASMQQLNMVDGAQVAAMRRYVKNALTLVNRAGMLRNLTTAMTNLITLERQAHDLDKTDGDKPNDHIPLEERVKSYTESLKSTGTDNVVPFK